MSQPYRIGFSTTNHLVSRIIRKLTGSIVSHTWVLYYDEDFKCDCVIEFTKGGCRLSTFDRFKQRNLIVKIWTPQCSVQKGFVGLRNFLEAGYDYIGLFGMLFVLFARWLKKKIRNPFASSKKLFCSECVVRLLQNAEYPRSDTLDPETVTPDDLYHFAIREEAMQELLTSQ